MTEPDDALRGALRDLIPDYTGPVDPLPRVLASVRRRRRTRQRALIAVGGTGLAAVLALAAPALLLSAGPGGGVRSANPGQSAGPVPTPSGRPAPPAPAPSVYPVAAGTVGGARWAIGSTTLAAAARLCLLSNDAIFRWDTVCFDGWRPGGAVTWSAQPVTGGGVTVTRIAGVTAGRWVRVRLTDDRAITVPSRRTPTDPNARFFGLVVRGVVTVRNVTAIDAAGADLGPPVTDPATVCRPGPNVLCN